MDFSEYLSKGGRKPYDKFPKIEKKCLECGKLIEEIISPVHRQGFCSQQCKNKYIGKNEF